MTNKPIALEVVCPKGIHPLVEFWLVFKGSKQEFWEKVPVLQTTYVVDTTKGATAKKYIDDIRQAISMALVRGPFTKFAYNVMVAKLHSLYPDAYMTIVPWEEILVKADKIAQPLVLGEPVTEEPKPSKMQIARVPKRIVSSVMEIPYSNEAVIQLFAMYPDENTTEVDLEIHVPILEGTIAISRNNGLGSYRTILESMAHECLILGKHSVTEHNYTEFVKGVLHMQVLTELDYDWDRFAKKAPSAVIFRMMKERDMKGTTPFFINFEPAIGPKPSKDVLDAILYAFHHMSAMQTGRTDCSKSNKSAEPKSTLGAMKHAPTSCADNHPFIGKHFPLQDIRINKTETGLVLVFGIDPRDEKYAVDFLCFSDGVQPKMKNEVARLIRAILLHEFTEKSYMMSYEKAKKFHPQIMSGSKLFTFKTVLDALEYKHSQLSELEESKIGVPKEKQLGVHLANNKVYSVTLENLAIMITENETGFKMPIARLHKPDHYALRSEVIFLGFKALVQQGITEDSYNAWLEISKPHIKEWRTYSLVEQMVLGAEKNWNKKEE